MLHAIGAKTYLGLLDSGSAPMTAEVAFNIVNFLQRFGTASGTGQGMDYKAMKVLQVDWRGRQRAQGEHSPRGRGRRVAPPEAQRVLMRR